MSYRRKSRRFNQQRFAAEVVEKSERRRAGELVFVPGDPVRLLNGHDLWGVPPGKYKARVDSDSVDMGSGEFVRVIVTRAPSDGQWMLGKPLHIAPRCLKLLPTKRAL